MGDLSQPISLPLPPVLMYELRNLKIPDLQDGYAYLTTHRACFVGNIEPRKTAVALELKTVAKSDFYVSYLKRESPTRTYRLTIDRPDS